MKRCGRAMRVGLVVLGMLGGAGVEARAAGEKVTTVTLPGADAHLNRYPVGTTAMGRDGDPQAVLTPRLQVRDGAGGLIAGLRVVDAGAMPTITSGNTNSPTLMMAEKAARWIRGA